jgi:hypothetical protein
MSSSLSGFGAWSNVGGAQSAQVATPTIDKKSTSPLTRISKVANRLSDKTALKPTPVVDAPRPGVTTASEAVAHSNGLTESSLKDVPGRAKLSTAKSSSKLKVSHLLRGYDDKAAAPQTISRGARSSIGSGCELRERELANRLLAECKDAEMGKNKSKSLSRSSSSEDLTSSTTETSSRRHSLGSDHQASSISDREMKSQEEDVAVLMESTFKVLAKEFGPSATKPRAPGQAPTLEERRLAIVCQRYQANPEAARQIVERNMGTPLFKAMGAKTFVSTLLYADSLIDSSMASSGPLSDSEKLARLAATCKLNDSEKVALLGHDSCSEGDLLHAFQHPGQADPTSSATAQFATSALVKMGLGPLLKESIATPELFTLTLASLSTALNYHTMLFAKSAANDSSMAIEANLGERLMRMATVREVILKGPIQDGMPLPLNKESLGEIASLAKDPKAPLLYRHLGAVTFISYVLQSNKNSSAIQANYAREHAKWAATKADEKVRLKEMKTKLQNPPEEIHNYLKADGSVDEEKLAKVLAERSALLDDPSQGTALVALSKLISSITAHRDRSKAIASSKERLEECNAKLIHFSQERAADVLIMLNDVAPHERAAAYGYTTGDYAKLNSALRQAKGQPLSDPGLQEYHKSVCAALQKLPTTQNTLYRSICSRPGGTSDWGREQLLAVAHGGTAGPHVLGSHEKSFVDYAFSSTSQDGAPGGPYNLELQGLEGVAFDIGFLSAFPGEGEFVLLPGTELVVFTASYDAAQDTGKFVMFPKTALEPHSLSVEGAAGKSVSSAEYLAAGDTLAALGVPSPLIQKHAAQLYEKAAEMLQKEAALAASPGELEAAASEVFAARIKACQVLTIDKGHPVNGVLGSGQGRYVSRLGSGVVKNGAMRVEKRTDDGVEANYINFKVSRFARQQLDDTVSMIAEHGDALTVALQAQGLLTHGDQVSVESNCQFTFSRRMEDGTFSAEKGLDLRGGAVTRIKFPGLGEISIPNEKYGSLYQAVEIKVDADASNPAQAAQQMAALLGLGPTFMPQSADDEKRLKLAKIFHTNYPKEAVTIENKQAFYEKSTASLQEEMVQLAAKRIANQDREAFWQLHVASDVRLTMLKQLAQIPLEEHASEAERKGSEKAQAEFAAARSSYFDKLANDHFDRKAIAQARQEFQTYLVDKPHLLQRCEVADGLELWAVADVSEKMRTQGAMGLMMGIAGWGPGETKIEKVANAIAGMLTNGALSTYERYQTHGLFAEGAASPTQDLRTGGADGVFMRTVTENFNGATFAEAYRLSGDVVLVVDLDAANEGCYGYAEDLSGTKFFLDEQYEATYQNRETLPELTRQLNQLDLQKVATAEEKKKAAKATKALAKVEEKLSTATASLRTAEHKVTLALAHEQLATMDSKTAKAARQSIEKANKEFEKKGELSPKLLAKLASSLQDAGIDISSSSFKGNVAAKCTEETGRVESLKAEAKKWSSTANLAGMNSNEVIKRSRLQPSHMKCVAVTSEAEKAELIAALDKLGVVVTDRKGKQTINGIDANRFVRVSTQVDPSLWQ